MSTFEFAALILLSANLVVSLLLSQRVRPSQGNELIEKPEGTPFALEKRGTPVRRPSPVSERRAAY
jgi:hypothetical protein